jgi:hypothetical protein
VRSNCSNGSATTTYAHADPVNAFKNCCRNGGSF